MGDGMDSYTSIATQKGTETPATVFDSGTINLEMSHSRTLNLAMAHNCVPIIQELRLTNRTTESLNELIIKVDVRPELSELWETRIADLPSEATYNITTINVTVQSTKKFDHSAWL